MKLKPTGEYWILCDYYKWGWFVAKKKETVAGVFATVGMDGNLWQWMSTDEKIAAMLKPLGDATKNGSSVCLNPLGFYEAGVRLIREFGYSISQQHPPDGWDDHGPNVVY